MKRRNVLIIISILIVILIGVVVFLFIKSHSKEEEKPKGIVSLETIKGYDYVLEDRDIALFKEKFMSLKEELEGEVVDYSVYASLLSELYIIDLYTISNKMNHYDVGGTEYVHPDAKENYELKVQDTIYKYVEDDTYGKRVQDLPTVSAIEVKEVKEEMQEVNEEEVHGYTVGLTWEYEVDLGYDKEATIRLAKIDDKLYVIRQAALLSVSES